MPTLAAAAVAWSRLVVGVHAFGHGENLAQVDARHQSTSASGVMQTVLVLTLMRLLMQVLDISPRSGWALGLETRLCGPHHVEQYEHRVDLVVK